MERVSQMRRYGTKCCLSQVWLLCLPYKLFGVKCMVFPVDSFAYIMLHLDHDSYGVQKFHTNPSAEPEIQEKQFSLNQLPFCDMELPLQFVNARSCCLRTNC